MANERHADVRFALNDAFKHARRQLQDRVRRVQGQVKHHEAAAIVRVDPAGEFGFLESGDGQEIYFNRAIASWTADLFVSAKARG